VTLWRKMARVKWSVAKPIEYLQDPGTTLKKYLYAARRGATWDDATTFNAQRGIDTDTVESWAQQPRAIVTVPASRAVSSART
jgi:hypothetical protein